MGLNTCLLPKVVKSLKVSVHRKIQGFIFPPVDPNWTQNKCCNSTPSFTLITVTGPENSRNESVAQSQDNFVNFYFSYTLHTAPVLTALSCTMYFLLWNSVKMTIIIIIIISLKEATWHIAGSPYRE